MGRGVFGRLRQLKAATRDTPPIIERTNELSRLELADEEAAAQLRTALQAHPAADRHLLEEIWASPGHWP